MRDLLWGLFVCVVVCVGEAGAAGGNCTRGEELAYEVCVGGLGAPHAFDGGEMCGYVEGVVKCASGCVCGSEAFEVVLHDMHGVWHDLGCGEGHLECSLSAGGRVQASIVVFAWGAVSLLLGGLV